MAALLERHNEYIAAAEAKGSNVLALNCPICEQSIKTLAPEEQGDTWDSLSQCPRCEAMYMKVVTSEKADGFVPSLRQQR